MGMSLGLHGLSLVGKWGAVTPAYPAIVVTHGLQDTWDVRTAAGHNPATLDKVVGVDSLPTGATIGGVDYYVQVSGNNVTLENWDFGAHELYVTGDNCTVNNCLIAPGNDTETHSYYAVDVETSAQGLVINNSTISALHMRTGASTNIQRNGATAVYNDCKMMYGELKNTTGGAAVHNRCLIIPGSASYDAHLDGIQPDGGSVELNQCFFDFEQWDGYGTLDHATRSITAIAETGTDRVRLTFATAIPSYWIANGERSLQIQDVGGATELNADGVAVGHFWRMQAIVDQYTVDLCKVSEAGTLAGIDYSDLSAYTSGGTAQISPIPFTNYIRIEASVGVISSAIINECIGIGFAGVPGSYAPMTVGGGFGVTSTTWTNNLWSAGVTGLHITPLDADSVTFSGNYDFDTGEEILTPLPDQFGTGDWSVADDETSGDITISITSLPDDGGSALTDLEYRLDSGSWVSLAGTTTGDYSVSGLTDDQEYDVAIRAVSGEGNGPASATKAVTPTAGGAWTTVFDETTAFATGSAIDADDSGWNGYTMVVVVPIASFSATDGTKIRLTLRGGEVEGFIASAIWCGNGGGGHAYDFTGDQVRLQQSASNTITVGTDGTVVTDEIAFVKDGTNPLVMALQFQTTTDTTRRISSGFSPAGYSTWYKSGADASTEDKTGYTDHSANGFQVISKIELFI